MEQKRSTRLVLRTSDLTANSTTAIGQCDQYRQNFTWFNINLRNLLGDLYEQYDYFNISLVSMSSSAASATLQGNIDDKTVYVEMSGLPFVNQTYDQPSQNNHTSATLTIYQIPTTAIASTQQYNNSQINVLTFGKSQDLCNINIALLRVLDNKKPTTLTIANPQFAFIFIITGVDKSYNPDKINYLMKK